MKKTSPLVFIVFFNLSNASGQQIDNISSEVIKKNKLYKCVEYFSGDSLTTRKDTSTAHYVIFNTQGQKIEQDIGNGTQVLYMYDNLGRRLMFAWYDKNSIPQISRIHIYKYNENGIKIGYCEYYHNSNPTCDSVRQYFYHLDTIRNRTKKTLITIKCQDKNMNDTVSKYFEYYNNNRLDSTKSFDYRLKETNLTTFIYNSSHQKVYAKQIRLNDKNRVLSRKESYYLPNGLLDYVEIRNFVYSAQKRSWDFEFGKTTFDYFYRD
jgi:hypothetical protein